MRPGEALDIITSYVSGCPNQLNGHQSPVTSLLDGCFFARERFDACGRRMGYSRGACDSSSDVLIVTSTHKQVLSALGRALDPAP